MRWKMLLFAMAAILAVSWAASLTYQQDGTPILTYGTEASGTSITNINADDSLYYILNSSAVGTPAVMVLNPSMNGSVNSWTLGTDGNAPGGTNTWIYNTTAGYYNSSPGSGNRITTMGTGTNNIRTGNAYQAPTGTVDQTTVNAMSWAMKYTSHVVGNSDMLAMCGEVVGTIAGTASSRLYWCYFITGSAPVDTATVKYITLGSGTSTAWQSFTRDLTTDIDSKWGAGTAYSISQVQVVNVMRKVAGGGTASLNVHYDDIYLTRCNGCLVDVQHKSQANVAAPAGHTLMRVYVSDKFYSSNSTPTYQLQWWNTNTAGWENCGAAAAQGSESARTCDTSTNPSYYINASDSSKMAMRLYTNTVLVPFQSRENYLFYRIWFPNLTTTAIAPSADPAPAEGTFFQVNCSSSVDADYGIADANYYLLLSNDGGSSWTTLAAGSTGLQLNATTPTNPLASQSISAGGTTTNSWYVNAVAAGSYQLKCVTNSTSAGEQNSSALAVTVPASAFVDTSITSATISFGNLDPGTTANAATEGLITLTNTNNSNVAIDTYLQSTVLTSGGFTIGVANIKVGKINIYATATPLVLAPGSWLNGAGPDQGYYEDTAINGTQTYYFWLDVPAGQDEGAYTGTLAIKSVKSGNTP